MQGLNRIFKHIVNVCQVFSFLLMYLIHTSRRVGLILRKCILNMVLKFVKVIFYYPMKSSNSLDIFDIWLKFEQI